MCHELVLSTTNLFAEYFLRFGRCCTVTLFSFFISFSLWRKMHYISTRLISFFSSGLELYDLSKHRCWSFFLLLLFPIFLILYGDGGCSWITALCTTSVTSLISYVLTEEKTIDIGIPFLSVKIYFFAYLASVSRIMSCDHRHSKWDFMDILSMDCQVQLIPIIWS